VQAIAHAKGSAPESDRSRQRAKGRAHEEAMTREEALSVVRAIEGLAATSPHDDPGARADVRSLAELLKEAPGPRYEVEVTVASIITWTEILFSADQRRNYGGDEEVTALLLHDCERLREVIRAD
jgi:hypothetical protein